MEGATVYGPALRCRGVRQDRLDRALPMTSDSALKPLNRLVGSWTTEATHPAVPGVLVQGTASIEWLEGERFLIHRARTDHPDFPDAISIIGFTERDRVHNATSVDPET